MGVCLYGPVEVGKNHLLSGHKGALFSHNWSTNEHGRDADDFQGHRVNTKAGTIMCYALGWVRLNIIHKGREVTSEQYCSLNHGIKKHISHLSLMNLEQLPLRNTY